MKLKVESLPPPFEGSFEAANLTVITGVPNSGKTFLLRYLHALNVLEDKVAFPMLYALSKYRSYDRRKSRSSKSYHEALENLFYSSLMTVLPYEAIDHAYRYSRLSSLKDPRKYLEDAKDVIFITAGRYSLTDTIDEFIVKSQISQKSFDRAIQELGLYDLPFDVEAVLSSIWLKSKMRKRLYSLGLPHFVHLARLHYVLNEIIEEYEIMKRFLEFSRLLEIVSLGKFKVDNLAEKIVFEGPGASVNELGKFSGAALASLHLSSILAASKAHEVLLLIDEPELLFHPTSQYALGIALFLLTSQGVKMIVVTPVSYTHLTLPTKA